MKHLDYSETELNTLGGYWTAKEIQQQPVSWTRTLESLKQKDQQIKSFLRPLLAKKNLRIILTGAGSSAFIGNSVAPVLSTHLNIQVEAIATTDLVSNPSEFLRESVPTLLVSFARSGNSPESIAAFDYAETIVNHCYQIAITCNPNGALYKHFIGPKKLALLMPEETNDKSLAMTSSFSSMLLCALYLFYDVDTLTEKLKATINATELLIEQHSQYVKEISAQQYERIIFLGSGALKGLSQEAALKLLELTDGKIISGYDSPLGFRHGPKAMANKNTLIIVFLSNQSHTRLYDLDLLTELQNDAEIGSVKAISAIDSHQFVNEHTILLDHLSDVEDIFLLFPYIVCAQMLAFHYAVAVGNTPDNPSASGAIHRVVQGVTIYDLCPVLDIAEGS